MRAEPRVAVDGRQHQERQDEGLILRAVVKERVIEAQEVHGERGQRRDERAGAEQREPTEREQQREKVYQLVETQHGADPAPRFQN